MLKFSLPGSLSKGNHSAPVGFASQVKQPHSSSSSIDMGPMSSPNNPSAPSLDSNVKTTVYEMIPTNNESFSCDGGDQRPASMRDCTSADPQVHPQKVVAPSTWPAVDALPSATVDRQVCSGDVDLLQRASYAIHQPTTTIPPTVMPPMPAAPGVMPGSDHERASEAYAHYLRSLQSLGQPTPRWGHSKTKIKLSTAHRRVASL